MSWLFKDLVVIIKATLSWLFKDPINSGLAQFNHAQSRVMRMRHFWAQNGPFPQMIIFSENLLTSLVSTIHAYLHAKNQSQILIYLLMKYWRLKNTEISLAKSVFDYNLRTRFFPSMQFSQNVSEP